MTRDLGPVSPTRCLLVWLTATSLGAGAAAALLPDVLAAPGGDATFESLFVATCEAALVAAAGWLWLVTFVVLTDAVRGRSGSRRGVPERLRRLLLVTCGAALAGGLAVPAHADDASVLRGVPLPDRVSSAQHVAHLVRAAAAHEPTVASEAVPAPAPAPRHGRSVVVAPGDTLWALAAAGLPAGAGDAAVAARVARLYAANRATVGPDPDLIRPGQELRLP